MGTWGSAPERKSQANQGFLGRAKNLSTAIAVAGTVFILVLRAVYKRDYTKDMNRLVTIYAIVKMDSGEAYVGSTVQRKQRWATHRAELRHDRHHCRHLQHAWNKYGGAAFDFIVLHEEPCDTREERFTLETKWIMSHGTYNVLIASDRAGQFTVSDADRAQRSKDVLARIKADPDYAARLHARGNALAAMQRTPEGRVAMGGHTARRWTEPKERAKLAKGLENRWADPDHHATHAETMKALRSTPEERKRQSEALKAAWADPNSKLNNRAPGRWDNPEAKARQADKMRAYHAAKRR